MSCATASSLREDKLDSFKRFKDDVKEVAQGYECGIGLEKFNDIKEGDIFEAYHYGGVPGLILRPLKYRLFNGFFEHCSRKTPRL